MSGKVQERFVNITPEDVWELQTILDGKTGYSKETHKNQTEAKDKVWALNFKTEKALAPLEIVHVRLEKNQQAPWKDRSEV